MPTFRFLHISDLHVSAIPRQVGVADIFLAGSQALPHLSLVSSHDPELLEGVAFLAYYWRREIDAILITGDLSTTGVAKDLNVAHDFVDAAADLAACGWTSHTGKPTLQGAGIPIFLIPGNHDRFHGLRLLPGGTEFDTVFSKYWGVKQSAQILGYLPSSDPSLVLIGVDFSLLHKNHARGHGGKWGQGRAYSAVIRELSRLTWQVRSANPDLGIIWLVHFPPKFPEGAGELSLIHEDKLLRAARLCKVSTILAGHTHNPKRYSIPDPAGDDVEVFCAGTPTQLTSPVGHVAHLIDVTVLANGKTELQWRDLWWNDIRIKGSPQFG